MFTSALARVFDSAGEPPPTVQLIIGVLVVAIACVLAVIYWRSRSHASSIAVDSEQPNLNEANASRAFGSEPGHSNSTSEADVADMEVSSEIESLMSAVREQAVELRCEHTKALSTQSLSFELLSNRLATIGPLLAKTIKSANESKTLVGLLTVSIEDYKKRLAEAEQGLGSPLCSQ